jgi:hypothetical protein
MLTVTTDLNSLASGQYESFDFNSFCEINGDVYGANESGIFKLNVGERDVNSALMTSPVEASMQLGPTDLGILTDKRLRKCIVSLEAKGQVKLTVTANEDTDAGVEIVQIPGTSDGREHAIAIPFGRDLRGRYFTFLFENVNGSYFSINNMEVFIEVLLRKPEKEGAI